MFGIIVRIITAAGPVIYKIPGAGAAAQRIAAQLVKNGGKIIKPPKGGFKGPTKVATPANVAKAIKDLKKSNTGAGRPTGKKPGSNVKKKNETIASGQQGPGGVTVRPPTAPKKPATQQGPGGVTVKPPGGKPPTAPRTAPKKPTKPKVPKKGPKSPFAKRTAKEKAADAAKLKRQQEAMKKPNRATNSGRFDKKGSKITNVPKTGGKAKKGGLKTKKGFRTAALVAAGITLESGAGTPIKTKSDFGNSGKGGPARTRPPVKEIPVVKPKKGPMKVEPKKDESFGAAFKRNRADKQPTFPWKDPKTGKTGKYTTRLKEESIADHKKKFGVTGKY